MAVHMLPIIGLRNITLAKFAKTLHSSVRLLSTGSSNWSSNTKKNVYQEVMPLEEDVRAADNKLSADVIAKVNTQISRKEHGRLFAVVRIFGKQFKITQEDIIVLQNDFIPELGESVQLTKVLLVGSSDFTLIGRPLLNHNLVKVNATVIEKTLSHLVTSFNFRKRKNHRRIRFRRNAYTMLRINTITIEGDVNRLPDEETLV